MKEVIVLVGTGSIGVAAARRVSATKHLLLADLHRDNADAVANTLSGAGFTVSTTTVDITSKSSVRALVNKAASLGRVSGIIHAAGVPPSSAPPEMILKVDLYGTAVVLEEFGKIIGEGASCVVISSQAGHRLLPLTVKQNELLATTPADELLSLPMLKLDQFENNYHVYQIAKLTSSLRVKAEAVKWGERGARVNTISPGIVMTPLANSELEGPKGKDYKNMIELCPAKRAGTPDEIGNLAALLMGPEGEFITGSDFLIDGGMTAAHWFGG